MNNINQNEKSVAELIHKLTKYQSRLASADASKSPVYIAKISEYTGKLTKMGGNLSKIQNGGDLNQQLDALKEVLIAKIRDPKAKINDRDMRALTDSAIALREAADQAAAKYSELETAHDNVKKSYKGFADKTITTFADISGEITGLPEHEIGVTLPKDFGDALTSITAINGKNIDGDDIGASIENTLIETLFNMQVMLSKEDIDLLVAVPGAAGAAAGVADPRRAVIINSIKRFIGNGEDKDTKKVAVTRVLDKKLESRIGDKGTRTARIAEIVDA